MAFEEVFAEFAASYGRAARFAARVANGCDVITVAAWFVVVCAAAVAADPGPNPLAARFAGFAAVTSVVSLVVSTVLFHLGGRMVLPMLMRWLLRQDVPANRLWQVLLLPRFVPHAESDRMSELMLRHLRKAAGGADRAELFERFASGSLASTAKWMVTLRDLPAGAAATVLDATVAAVDDGGWHDPLDVVAALSPLTAEERDRMRQILRRNPRLPAGDAALLASIADPAAADAVLRLLPTWDGPLTELVAVADTL